MNSASRGKNLLATRKGRGKPPLDGRPGIDNRPREKEYDLGPPSARKGRRSHESWSEKRKNACAKWGGEKIGLSGGGQPSQVFPWPACQRGRKKKGKLILRRHARERQKILLMPARWEGKRVTL